MTLRRRRAAIDRNGRRGPPLPVVLIGTVLAAEVAVWLLRPRWAVQRATVPESSYFTPSQLERARDFAAGQRLLGLGAIAAQGAFLGLIVERPPRRLIRSSSRIAQRRDFATGALLGAGLGLLPGIEGDADGGGTDAKATAAKERLGELGDVVGGVGGVEGGEFVVGLEAA